MQAPPAFSLSVTRFGAWRGLCLAVALAAVGSACAWAWGRHAEFPQAFGLPLLAAGLAFAACRAPAPFHLRWDTRQWHVGDRPGALSVAFDAGGCLLLRFVPEGGRGVQWLPVQRRGHTSAWHALRCTVHGSRPAAAGPGDTP